MQKQELRSYLLLALIALSVALALYILYPFVTPLLLAMIFAVVLSPVHTFFLKRFGSWKGAAALATVVTGFVCVLLPLSLILSLIGIEAQQLYVSLTSGESKSAVAQQALTTIQTHLQTYFPHVRFSSSALLENADTYIQQGLQWILSHSVSAATGAASFALEFFLFVIALFYMLRDGKELRRALMDLSPLTERDDELLFGRLTLAINSVIRGNLAVSFIQGVVATIGLTLFEVPQSILWGVVAMLSSLIPGVGTSFVTIPAIIYVYFAHGTLPAIGLACWAIAAVGTIDNFLGPKLVGKGMKIHPLFVLFSVLGVVSVFGPVGIFLGPLSISFLAAIVSVYLDRPLGESSS